MKRAFIIHPVLLAAYPTLFLYSLNIGLFPLSAIWAPIALTLVIAGAAWGATGLLLRDMHKGALIASVSLALFFSYGRGEFRDLGESDSLAENRPGLSRSSSASGSWLWARASMAKLTLISNVIAGVLVAFVLRDIVQARAAERVTVPLEDVPRAPMTHGAPRPDIYFILLDAYARADVLESLYGYDNAPFLAELRARGFHIAERSTSNYMQTMLSLGSLFNLMYLDEFAKAVRPGVLGSSADAREVPGKSGRRLPESAGLHAHRLARVGRPDTEMPNADVYIDYGAAADTFGNALLNTTPIPDLWPGNRSAVFDRYRGQILFIFDGLRDVALRESPKFVFAHIESPHPPFVFGPNGEPREAK